MLHVFVLDDERIFSPPRADATVRYYRSAAGCGAALQGLRVGVPVHELWLDHDLGGNDTTRAFVNALEEHAFTNDQFAIGKIYIHTANTVGRAWIYAALHRGYDVECVNATDHNLIKMHPSAAGAAAE